MNSQSPKLLKPLWREPIAIGIGAVVLLACAGILLQDHIFPGAVVDPANKAPYPPGRGAAFVIFPHRSKAPR